MSPIFDLPLRVERVNNAPNSFAFIDELNLLALEYYKILVNEYKKLKGGLSSPLLIIESLNLEELRNLVNDDKWDEVVDIITQSARNLERSKAEVIIIATNTIHKIFDRVQENIETPMINLLVTIADAIKEQGIKKVGLLGTIYTMQLDFFQKALDKYNIGRVFSHERVQGAHVVLRIP